jgi:hypothetical protein
MAAEVSEYARIVGLDEISALAKFYANRIAEKEVSHQMETQALQQRIRDLESQLAAVPEPAEDEAPEEPVRESSHAV